MKLTELCIITLYVTAERVNIYAYYIHSQWLGVCMGGCQITGLAALQRLMYQIDFPLAFRCIVGALLFATDQPDYNPTSHARGPRQYYCYSS